MAERRMFARAIVLSDAFLDMPMSARCLYFTLGMFADDDGFVGSPKAIMRQCGASTDDLRVLLGKRYVLAFESGVIVIKHWRINNYLQNDRHKATTYVEELGTLTTDEKGAYTEKDRPCIQNVYTGKDSIGKDSKEINSNNTRRFTPPTCDEVQAYCTERKNSVDVQQFMNYYESNGWRVGKNPMKDWRAAVRTWERNGINKKPQTEKKDEREDYDAEMKDIWLREYRKRNGGGNDETT